MSSVVRVAPDGTVEAVYDDELADVLGEVGSFEIRRVSHIEYDNVLHGWMVELLRDSVPEVVGDGLCGSSFVGPFRTKAAAGAWEVAYLDARLAGDADGEAALAAIKAVPIGERGIRFEPVVFSVVEEKT